MNIPKVSRRISKVFVHCSASDNPAHDNIETIRKWHLERGFKEVGYHYFITKAGDVVQGRGLELIPAAQEGHNTGSIAICLHGLEKQNFTEAQFKALNQLADSIQAVYPQVTFHGHCEVSRKACPVLPYKQVLGLGKQGIRTKGD